MHTAEHQFQLRYRLTTAAAVGAVLLYLAALSAVDVESSLISKLGALAGVLPVVILSSFVAFWIRSLRWLWLLRLHGYKVPMLQGFLRYLTGMALGATPGKVGELVRLRYFGQLKIPHQLTISCFVFERLLDLLVLLAFAGLLAGETVGFEAAVGFVVLVVLAIVAIVSWPKGGLRLQYALRRWGFRLLAKWVHIVFGGVRQTVQFLPLRRLLPAIVLGLLAWAIQCAGFALALAKLDIAMPYAMLFAIPPTAMLVGAASMSPGGVGTTEAVLVGLLVKFGAAFDVAVIAAIAIRVGSLWFATLLGFAAVALLEWQARSKLHDTPQSASQAAGSGSP